MRIVIGKRHRYNEGTSQFGQITYVSLFILTVIVSFGKITEGLFPNTFSFELVQLLLCSTIFFRERTEIKRKWKMLFFSYIVITVFYYYYFSSEFHFDRVLIVKNIVLNIMQALSNLMLFFTFYTSSIDRKIESILRFIFSCQVITYILYIFLNSSDGVFPTTWGAKYIMQDGTGRFKGTFSEPVVMGFMLGISVFYILIKYDTWLKYPITGILMYIIFFECKAKFAVIALPIAIFIAIGGKYKFKYFWHIIIIAAFVGVIALSYYVRNNVIISLSFIGEYFGRNSSFFTRFFFIFTAMIKLVKYPLGTGFGLSYEYFSGMESLLDLGRTLGMDTSEVRSYIENQSGAFSSKDSFSMIVSSFGFVGIILYLGIIKRLITMKVYRRHLVRGLIVFILLESTVTVNILHFPYILYGIFCIMLINSMKVNNKLFLP